MKPLRFAVIFEIVAEDRADGGENSRSPYGRKHHALWRACTAAFSPPRLPSPPLLPDRPSPSLPAQGSEWAGTDCSTIVWVASEPRVLADQFQRNGVILDQRCGVWNDDTGAVSRGGAGRLYWHL
jgi:hypothetical protein